MIGLLLWILLLVGPPPAQAQQATTGAGIADLTVTTTSQQLVGADPSRLAVTCTNNDASNGIRWCGGCTPTSSLGALLQGKSSITDYGTYAINVIRDTSATGNPVLSCTRANR